MLYQGSDGKVHVLGDGDELKHYKYIKKIKTGNGYRYFYSQDEIDAYYKENKTRENRITENKMSEHRMTENKMSEHRMTENKIREKRTPEKKTKDSNFNRNVKPIDSEYEKAKKYNSQVNDYSGGKTNKDIERENRERKEARKNKIKDSINKKIDRTSKSINKGRSVVEKKLKKAKKTVKSEAKGAKRATNAIRGKGNYTYDGWGNYYNYKKKYKPKKSGRIEKGMIKAYRKTHPYE